MDRLSEAKALIKETEKDKIVVFSGAGISIASGIPPFRGKDGLWSKYDPTVFDIDFFLTQPAKSWHYIKEIFYSYLLKDVKPNAAHYAVAKLGCPVITQNIDGLHQAAGSKEVVEFHGTAETLVCVDCKKRYNRKEVNLNVEIPRCRCGGILKPDFVFFKEPIPQHAFDRSIELAENCKVMIVVGTTGEIMPASRIPYLAKRHGAKIIEVNVAASNFTYEITDIFLKGKAEEILPLLVEE
ncbi:SIR2 family NAD-dependent protein deacylase [Hippea jasoniae]|uniref:SIR2 family NAD-dependent protein deacylase n=1 Tax=Hippea jasoniae TaxID=944479 RepID=UPI0005571865|nr:NAD-dependent deacylase [Hippea jasoniae]